MLNRSLAELKLEILEKRSTKLTINIGSICNSNFGKVTDYHRLTSETSAS